MLQQSRNPFLNRRVSEPVHTVEVRRAFKKIFFALSRQTGCPNRATNKYYNLIEARLRNEGAGFLKILAAQPILGLRILGKDIPDPSDYGLAVRSRTSFPYLFAWHYAELNRLSLSQPTKSKVLRIRRILTVLSIGKMIAISSDARLNHERALYADSARRYLNFSRIAELRKKHRKSIRKFLEFVHFKRRSGPIPGGVPEPVVGHVTLDPCCYSLKSLSSSGNRQYRYSIPEAVTTHLMHRSIRERSMGLFPGASGLAIRTVPDGKQSVLVELGGKFRGITHYFSPLVHSSSVYRAMRGILAGWRPDCSLDQSKGHRAIKLLTSQKNTSKIISADASNFTDSLDIDLLHVLLEECGEDGFLEYLGDLSIGSYKGTITSNLPLMGIKGCFECGSVMLAYATWLVSSKRSRFRRRKLNDLELFNASHCCDDFACLGDLKSVASAYQMIGADLNYKKTVVSYNAAVFCGEMYWKGERVTPVRLNITSLITENSGTFVLPYVRSFLDRCQPVYGRAVRRIVNRYIVAACLRSVGPYCVRFDLPTKIGGVPIPTKFGTKSLLSVLSGAKALRYALYNTPLEVLEPDVLTTMIGYVRLGNPVKQPDGTILPSVSLPTIGKSGWKRRRLLVDQLYRDGTLTVTDVLEYYYS